MAPFVVAGGVSFGCFVVLVQNKAENQNVLKPPERYQTADPDFKITISEER